MESPRRFRPRLPALLGFDELDALHWSALQVLDKVGLHVADENCLQALEGHEHITRKGSRLHFDPDFVHTEVADHRDRSSPPTVDGGHDRGIGIWCRNRRPEWSSWLANRTLSRSTWMQKLWRPAESTSRRA